jgi:hypothetical protein
MTEEDKDRLDDGREWMGQTLRGAFDLVKAMPRLPDCAICPAGQWYVLEGESSGRRLEGFCTQFRAVMYKDARNTVTQCDARLDAIAAIEAKATAATERRPT